MSTTVTLTLTDDDVLMDCWYCKGSGEIGYETPCPDCAGTGRQLTDMGDAIAAVIEHLRQVAAFKGK